MGDAPLSVEDLEEMAQATQELIEISDEDEDFQTTHNKENNQKRALPTHWEQKRYHSHSGHKRSREGVRDSITPGLTIGEEEGQKLLYKGGLLKRDHNDTDRFQSASQVLHHREESTSGRYEQKHRGSAREPECSEEQQKAVEAVLTGKNVFITGGAGVGKSFLVKKIVSELNKRRRRVQVCASTGVAAVQINGQTLNSFAGIGLAKETKEVLAEQCYKGRRIRKRWKDVDVLLIDEISMIGCELFDKIDYVCRRCRGAEVNSRALFHREPMGGIQVVAVGDFFQLPPVSGSDSFAFDSGAWKSLNFVKVILTRVWRQSDPLFIGLLNEIRIGEPSERTMSLLKRCNRPLRTHDGILATKLYPIRSSVDSENKKHFDKLEGQTRTYVCDDFASNERAEPYLRLLDDIGVAKMLDTRLRMQVMLKSNLDIKAGLCNGSRGVIIGYQPFDLWKRHAEDEGALKVKYAGSLGRLRKWGEKHKQLPIVLFANGMKQAIPPSTWERSVIDGKASVTRLQIPLIPAWALTIHKSQGMSLDRVQINLVDVFSEGQAYVALSRARSLAGLQLTGFTRKSVKINKKVLKYYNISNSSSQQEDNDVDTQDGKSSDKPWSNEFEGMVYDVVKLNMQSALTQALGSGSCDFEALKSSFLRTAEKACWEVIQDCQENLKNFPHKACIPSTSNANKDKQEIADGKQNTEKKALPSNQKGDKSMIAAVETVVETDSDCTQDYDQDIQPTQRYSSTPKETSADMPSNVMASEVNWMASQQITDSE